MLADSLKKTIQENYSTLLERRQLQSRYGQKVMIAEIAKTLGAIEVDEEGGRKSPEPGVCVIEAGTGTGKTIAYLIAALPIAQALKKKLVIATATVALQEQVVIKDLPDLKQYTNFNFSFALAKGRGRYLCLSKLDNLLRNSSASQDAMFDLYGLELEDDSQPDMELYQDMLDKLSDGKWQGDRDDWPDSLDEGKWRMIAVEKNQCSGNRCAHFNNCCFFKSRNDLQSADCIVANHDLVLSDLSLGGGVILPDPEDCIYIFDEGHHLPIKGTTHFSHFLRLRSTAKWLEQLSAIFPRLAKSLSADNELADEVSEASDSAIEARTALHEAFLMFEQLSPDAESANAKGDIRQYTFPGGEMNVELQEVAQQNRLAFSLFSQHVQTILDGLRQGMEGNGAIERDEAESWFPAVGAMLNRAEGAEQLWQHLALDDPEMAPPMARWVTFSEFGGEQEIGLSCSPVIAADTLASTLWHQAFGVILTSATLSALGNFQFLQMRAGLPDTTRYSRIASPFDYANAGLLRIPGKGFNPSSSEEHTNAIVDLLPDLLSHEKGSLVLFSSRKQMQDVLYRSDKDFSESVLCQDDYSKQKLIALHKEKIDSGENSIIFGLASLTEGIDLPGDYCTHVVIAKIPFAVPNDPVEATLGQWIEAQGKNAFQEISMPEAALRLIQASGRLLRTEGDRGTITILDERLNTKPYGRKLLDSLPPYQREVF